MRQNRILLALALASALVTAAEASAQATGNNNAAGVAVEAVGGYAGFLDESTIHRVVAGGGGRFRLSPRVWVGGDVLYLWGPDDEHDWLIMPFVTLDLLSNGRVVPYLVAGGGWLRTTAMVGTGPYTSTSLTVGGGGGLRFGVGPNAYVAVEGRLGTEPLTRATVAVGWRLR
jgi:hypothetical protein